MEAQLIRQQPFVDKLAGELGADLHALILYGSAVRGGFSQSVSDINVLIVLRESTPAAHLKLRTALNEEPRIQTLIVGLPDLERTMRVFGLKFLSIGRSYRVLHGADVLANFHLDPQLHRDQAEEALRNLQLRMTRAFVLFGADHKRYSAYLLRSFPSIMVNVSEALRLRGVELPLEFAGRLPLLQQYLGGDAMALSELLALRKTPREISSDEAVSLHSRILALLTAALSELTSA